MGQGGDICKDALRETGDVIAMERPAENRGSCSTAHGSREGSKDCDLLGCPQPTGLGLSGSAGAHHTVTVAGAPCADASLLAPPASSSKQAQGTWGHKQLQRRGRGVRRAMHRDLQQPERAEALKGQRRDAPQGVVAEDPAKGKE